MTQKKGLNGTENVNIYVRITSYSIYIFKRRLQQMSRSIHVIQKMYSHHYVQNDIIYVHTILSRYIVPMKQVKYKIKYIMGYQGLGERKHYLPPVDLPQARTSPAQGLTGNASKFTRAPVSLDQLKYTVFVQN